MARKTNCVVGGKEYYRIYRTVGKKLNDKGTWVLVRKSFYGSCQKEAEQKYHEYVEQQKTCKTPDVCVGVLINEWIDTIFKSSKLANSTKVKYISAYNKIFRYSVTAGISIRDITAMDIQNLYNDCNCNYATIRALHNLLRRFFKYAELNNISRDITGSVTVPTGGKKVNQDLEIDVWKDEDLKKVIEALKGTTLRLLVVLAVNTGARFSELLALTYDDIKGDILSINKQQSEITPIDGNGEKIHITNTKTASSNRLIPLTKAVMLEIQRHKVLHYKEMSLNGYQTNYIFTTGKGTLYYKRNIIRSLKRLYKRLGVPYHKFHSFRHTFGTNLSRAGVPIEETAKLMGHSSVEITAKYYININVNRKRDALEKITKYSLED